MNPCTSWWVLKCLKERPFDLILAINIFYCFNLAINYHMKRLYTAIRYVCACTRSHILKFLCGTEGIVQGHGYEQNMGRIINIVGNIIMNIPIKLQNNCGTAWKSYQADMCIIFPNHQLFHYESQEISHKSPVITIDGIAICIRCPWWIVVTNTPRTVHNEYQVDNSRGTDDWNKIKNCSKISRCFISVTC